MSFSVQPQARYSASHEWVRLEGDVAVIGITDFAQHELGDVVYVDLPVVGDAVARGETFGACESVKAVADLYMPVSGEVIEINDALTDHPEWVNEDPYAKGWLVKVRPSNPAELDELMDAAAYAALQQT